MGLARGDRPAPPADGERQVITVRNRSGAIVSLSIGTDAASQIRRDVLLARIARGELELWTEMGTTGSDAT